MTRYKWNFKDADGCKYQIPEDMLADASALLDCIENAPDMSEEKWDAEDEFVEHFDQYMLDGEYD